MPAPLPAVRVETSDGIATVWLGFPGSPVNALSRPRLADLDRAVAPLLHDPHLDAVVIRSAQPAGFCGGFVPGILGHLGTDAAAAGFALAGQRILDRIAAADVTTVAFIEGPCLGPGLELALACDLRLAVAGPDSEFGFPDAAAGVPPCWGGPTRLRAARHLLAGQTTLTAREAHRAGLVDDAFCQRRAKVELRTWLDRIQAGRRKPGRSGDTTASLAAERTAFRHALRSPEIVQRLWEPESVIENAGGTIGFPDLIAVVTADPYLFGLPVEAALRGTRAVLVAPDPERAAADLGARFDEAVRRGRATPLEAKQARDRITVTPATAAISPAGFVVWDARAGWDRDEIEPHVRPAAVLAVVNAGSPGRRDRARNVGLGLWGVGPPHRCVARLTAGPRTAAEIPGLVAGWLPRLGVRAQLPPTTATVVVRVAA
jgi:enoyl-CoA hydratase/carnithine racemase